MAELNIDAPIDIIEVATQGDALEHGFLGSPTVRINGMDVDKSARSRTDFSLACRVYQTEKGLLGWPSKSMIIAAFKEALSKGR